MSNQNWKRYVLWIVICEAVGITAGLITRDATQLYNEIATKPAFSPPAILFPIVWSILYALMGISAARISLAPESKEKNTGLNLFVIQLIVNFFWSLIFFNARNYGFAFLWLIVLWILILLMILSFHKTDSFAAYLQIPYLLWVMFAGFLNYAVWQLN